MLKIMCSPTCLLKVNSKKVAAKDSRSRRIKNLDLNKKKYFIVNRTGHHLYEIKYTGNE